MKFPKHWNLNDPRITDLSKKDNKITFKNENERELKAVQRIV